MPKYTDTINPAYQGMCREALIIERSRLVVNQNWKQVEHIDKLFLPKTYSLETAETIKIRSLNSGTI